MAANGHLSTVFNGHGLYVLNLSKIVSGYWIYIIFFGLRWRHLLSLTCYFYCIYFTVYYFFTLF